MENPEQPPQKPPAELAEVRMMRRLRRERAEQKILARERAIKETEKGLAEQGITAKDIEAAEEAARIQSLRKPDPQM